MEDICPNYSVKSVDIFLFVCTEKKSSKLAWRFAELFDFGRFDSTRLVRIFYEVLPSFCGIFLHSAQVRRNSGWPELTTVVTFLRKIDRTRKRFMLTNRPTCSAFQSTRKIHTDRPGTFRSSPTFNIQYICIVETHRNTSQISNKHTS